jgi:hypothetical protein
MPEALESEFAQLAEYFREDRLRDTETYGSSIEAWARSLPTIGYLNPLSVRQGWNALAFIHLGPRGPLPGVPWRPSYVHGHLPFHGTCGGKTSTIDMSSFPKAFE